MYLQTRLKKNKSSFRNTNIKGYTGRVNPKTAAKGVAPQITQRNTVEKWLRSKATVNHLDTRNIFETLTIEDTLCSEYMEDIKPLAGLVIKIKKPVMESNNTKCSPREKIFTGSSQHIFPKIIRCEKCFIAHFPSTRICAKSRKQVTKISLSKSEFLLEYLKVKSNAVSLVALPKRLRGGIKRFSIPLMIKQAIESAAKHGIKLVPGVKNNADGNCQYESVLNNINYRTCFERKLNQHPNDYRYQWVTELEYEASKDPNIAAGYSDEEKREHWKELKRPWVYEVPYFGDFIMHGIARGCKKDLLIFNTSPEAFDPIYVISATKFGGQRDSDIPVVLAYNQHHYESLHPFSIEDINNTKLLANAYVNGNYMYTKKDIPHLIVFSKHQQKKVKDINTYLGCTFDEIKTHSDKVVQSKGLHDKIILDQFYYESNFPPLPSAKKSSKECANEACMLSLEELKMIQVKN